MQKNRGSYFFPLAQRKAIAVKQGPEAGTFTGNVYMVLNTLTCIIHLCNAIWGGAGRNGFAEECLLPVEYFPEHSYVFLAMRDIPGIIIIIIIKSSSDTFL